jgi:lipid-binding SYLF domain-containing protein
MKLTIAALLATLILLSGCSSPGGDTGDEKRTNILKMRDATLTRLFHERPETKAEIAAAPGYAVFSNLGTNVIFVAAGDGFGVAVDNATGKPTYMKMATVGFGLGIGVKDFRAVFVFHTKEVMDTFVNSGWDFGGDADAAAKSGDKGGAAGTAGSFANMTVYQLTETGLALQATLNGTKYWTNSDLN